jgi:hypothetical protein
MDQESETGEWEAKERTLRIRYNSVGSEQRKSTRLPSNWRAIESATVILHPKINRFTRTSRR